MVKKISCQPIVYKEILVALKIVESHFLGFFRKWHIANQK